MQHIDESKLESDPQYRYEYLAGFIGFGPDDVKLIQAAAPQVGPRIGELVEKTYAKLLSYDATARHFVPKQHGFEGETPLDLAALDPSHPQIQFRKDHLNRYFLALISGAAANRLYSPQATRRTYAHLASVATTVVEAGFPVIVDATFLQVEERAQFRELARTLGIPFRIIACTASEGELLARVSSRSTVDQDASDAGIAVLREQLLIETELTQEPVGELIIIDTSNETSVDEALKPLLNQLGERTH